jgi:hypothetical protein
VPPAEVLGRQMPGDGRPVEPVEAWSVPWFFDAMLGRKPDSSVFEEFWPFDPFAPPCEPRRPASSAHGFIAPA